MNHNERQRFIVTADRFNRAHEVFHDSKLHVLLESFKSRFPSKFPRLSYKEFFLSEEREKEFDMGLIIELEWNKIKDSVLPEAFYESKVAKIKIEPNGLIYFGKRKITPEKWKNWMKTEQALLNLMNNTKPKRYFQRTRKSFALPE